MQLYSGGHPDGCPPLRLARPMASSGPR